MSNINTLEAPTPDLEQLRLSIETVAAIGTTACITLSPEITFADLIGGKVLFTAETTIFDRSGAQIDAAELLTYVDVEGVN